MLYSQQEVIIMNTRQQKILAAVVEEYTNTAIAVSSDMLVKKYGFHVSPATIRNDMAKLEEEGYLYQPHVSAGRIPTDKGYKYFVDEIMPDQELSSHDQKRLQTELLKLKAQNNRISRTTAKLLTYFSGNFALSSLESDFSEFGIREFLKDPEFQEVDEFCKVAEALDYIDENIELILKQVNAGETKIFIGKENPVKELSNCSMIVSPYTTQKGEKGLLAIIGPKRMKYAKNKSLLDYVKKMLGSSLVVVILFNVV